MKEYKVVFIDGRFGSERTITLKAFDEEEAKTIIKRYTNVKEFLKVEKI